jgi:hypothetical protein
VLRICIRPLHGAFVLLAIMDIRAHLSALRSEHLSRSLRATYEHLTRT